MQIIQKGNADALDVPAEVKFDIQLQPVQTLDGLYIPTEQRRAVVDTTNNRVVGTCGKIYKPTAYYKVANLVNAGLRNSNINLNDIEVIDNVHDGGAKWHRKIVFNKIERSLAKVDDVVRLELNIHSSLDLSRKISSIFGALRLWCLNGCVTDDYSVQRNYKQTTNLMPDYLATNSVRALEMYENNIDWFDRLLATSITEDDAIKFFKETIGKLTKPTAEKKTYSESKVQKLLNRYRKEVGLQNKGNTLWTLYNTITNYSTHVDNVDWTGNTVDESGNLVQASLGGAKHNIMYNRELEVAKSLKHPLFQLAS